MKMVSSGMLRRVALVRTDVSEKYIASVFRVEIIRELGTTSAVTSRQLTDPRARKYCRELNSRLTQPEGVPCRYHDELISFAVEGPSGCQETLPGAIRGLCPQDCGCHAEPTPRPSAVPSDRKAITNILKD
jgi:hypothetical protein